MVQKEASARNSGYKCFQKSEAQLILSAVNKVLENWSLNMFVHLLALAEDKRLVGILRNKLWMNIFVSIYHFAIAKTALQSNIGSVEVRERCKELDM